MRRHLVSRTWLQRTTGCAALLLLAGCAGPSAAPGSSAAMSVPAGSARIWFYRDYAPAVSRTLAPVALNGRASGYVLPDGSAFYRDVSPGRYHVTVESEIKDRNQAKDFDLPAGQEAFVKILASNSWESGGDTTVYGRETFYVSLVSPQVARAELATRSLVGG